MPVIDMPQSPGQHPVMSPPPLTSVHPALRPGTPPVTPASPSKPRRFASFIMSLGSPKKSRPVLTIAAPQTPLCFNEKTNKWKPLPPVPAFSPWKDSSDRPLTPSKKSFCHPIPPGKREVSGSTNNSDNSSSKPSEGSTNSPLMFRMEESPTMPEHYSFMAESSHVTGSDATHSTSFTTEGSFPPRNDSLPGSAKLPRSVMDPELSWYDNSPTSSYETTPVPPTSKPADLHASPIEPAPLRLPRKPVPLSSPTSIHPAYRRDITDTSIGGVPLTPATPSKRSSSRSSKSAWWLSPLHKQAHAVEVFSPALSHMGDIQTTTPSVSRSTLGVEELAGGGTGTGTDTTGSSPSAQSDMSNDVPSAVERLRRFIDLMAAVEEQASGDKQEGARLAGMLVQRAVDVCELRGLA